MQSFQIRRFFIIYIFLITIGFQTYACKSSDPTGADKALYLFEKKEDRIWLKVEGSVIQILPDDVTGTRHQRFIIETEKGQSILINHNIDIAQRVPIENGTRLIISGEYLWNTKGGSMHYTHRNTNIRKRSGYIKVLATGMLYD